LRPLQLGVLFRLISVVALAALATAFRPSAVGAADSTWRGEYFANPDLAGNPAFVRSDRDINFDWGLGSPGPGIPVDRFSIRWTRAVYFPAAQWRFNVMVDDGVRLFVDGQLIIDQWRITAPATYSSSILLGSGDHDLRVEYFDNTERAQVRVWWDQGSASPTPVPPPGSNPWRGEYFDNRNLAGNPRFARDDAAISFNWGNGGPGGGIGGQNFSVRWTRSAYFDGGRYEFRATVDDGVRFWLDDNLLIDEWHDSSVRTYTRQVDVSGGNHRMRLEYYQAGGEAQVQFTWPRTDIRWVGNLLTCMRPQDSWVKVYRLTPNREWEDMKPSGWGPISASGEIKIDGLPIDPYYGLGGQPYRVELWVSSNLVASNGNIFTGQPEFRIRPGQDARTSWPCGAAIPQPGHGPPEH
jgi:hypothetical protein